jgi:hypothetical protein
MRSGPGTGGGLFTFVNNMVTSLALRMPSKPPTDTFVLAGYTMRPPVQLLAKYTATNAEIQPSLGRPISPGAGGTIPNIPFVKPGTLFGDRLNRLDVRISKSVSVGEKIAAHPG